jgi:hypothetical protein
MLHDIAITQFTKMLQNLGAILERARAHADAKKFDVEVLLGSRLAPDQFNFTRQVQIACDTAKLGVSRLTGKAAPSHPDDEKTLDDLLRRIKETVAYLEGFTSADFADAAERQVSQPRWAGKYLTGQEFALQHMVPNFYFHVTTAYAILRHNGVEIGKKDYLGPMPFKGG